MRPRELIALCIRMKRAGDDDVAAGRHHPPLQFRHLGGPDGPLVATTTSPPAFAGRAWSSPEGVAVARCATPRTAKQPDAGDRGSLRQTRDVFGRLQTAGKVVDHAAEILVRSRSRCVVRRAARLAAWSSASLEPGRVVPHGLEMRLLGGQMQMPIALPVAVDYSALRTSSSISSMASSEVCTVRAPVRRRT